MPRSAGLGLSGTEVFGRIRAALERADAAQIGLFFVTLAIGIYIFSNPSRSGWYNHFVWQSDAFLHGRFGIAYPVVDGQFVNGYFQDIMPLPSAPGTPSYGLLPFPPLPALLLMPFVAVFGLAADAQLFGVVLGAINVGLAWRMTTRLTTDRGVAFLATLFFAFGTVHWYAAIISTTWFLAHVVAITFLLMGITLALDAERRQAVVAALGRSGTLSRGGTSRSILTATIEESSLFLAWFRRLRDQIDGMQFLAGFVFGLAALSRLTILFGAPFFVFVGGGGSYRKRAISAGLGAVIPLGLLLAYNIVSSGHLFSPAYDWLYQNQVAGLGYMPDGFYGEREWGVENPKFIPLNAVLFFGLPPDIMPTHWPFDHCEGVARTLLSPTCPVVAPSWFGMSILLTSPAYLLIGGIVAAAWRKRVVMGALLAVVTICVVNLAHFSQGWVQFGQRFSNDFAPFALVLVTLGIGWLGVRKLTVFLVAASILVNAWGVYWGVTLGW